MYYKQCIEFKGFCCSRNKDATCDEIYGSPTILRTKVVLKTHEDFYTFLNVLTSQIMLLHEVILLQKKLEVVLCCHGILKEDESVVSVQVLLQLHLATAQVTLAHLLWHHLSPQAFTTSALFLPHFSIDNKCHSDMTNCSHTSATDTDTHTHCSTSLNC